MEFDDMTYNQIETYLSGLMNDSEKEAFELKMASDPKLDEEIQIHRSVASAIGEKEWVLQKEGDNREEIDKIKNLKRGKVYSEIEKKIQEVGSQYSDESERKKKNILFYYIGAIAAVIAILLLVQYFDNSPTTTETLYVEYCDWSELPSLVMQSDVNNEIEEGERLFTNKHYEEAIIVFSQIVNRQAEDNVIDNRAHALSYLGASYLEIGDYQNALKTFDSLLQKDFLDSSKGYWYKALVYIKMGDKEKAKKELLLTLKKETNYNYDKAKELLKKLNF
ncbi:tetratricopeptide repeat protein [Aquimarina sediminis]|uniref:tetratricopeptide repeat protein n=1 Tax=Aquimarina sediminis TaxID=2070536 RepID=UPI000CA06623|nr:tetratricopeptide repeat protein [Aquimarina sediminis]